MYPVSMDLAAHFALLARYNRVANEALFEKCAQLDDAEYRRSRPGSFGSIHALLNHMLLGDRIWMARFETKGGLTTPALDTRLFDDFAALRAARVADDVRIESFFAHLPGEFCDRTLAYTNSRGVACSFPMSFTLAQFFNHQTHHRGQVQVMLSQAGIQPPPLDIIRIVTP